MIPNSDTTLTTEQAARWQLTRLAAALVRDGVPITQVMADAREGCELGAQPALGRPLTTDELVEIAHASGWHDTPEPHCARCDHTREQDPA